MWSSGMRCTSPGWPQKKTFLLVQSHCIRWSAWIQTKGLDPVFVKALPTSWWSTTASSEWSIFVSLSRFSKSKFLTDLMSHLHKSIPTPGVSSMLSRSFAGLTTGSALAICSYISLPPTIFPTSVLSHSDNGKIISSFNFLKTLFLLSKTHTSRCYTLEKSFHSGLVLMVLPCSHYTGLMTTIFEKQNLS